MPINSKFSLEKKALTSAMICVALTGFAAAGSAGAATLNASSGGTFTFSLDRDALAPYVFGGALGNNGYFLTSFWNTAASDHTDPANSEADFAANVGTTEISAVNLVHDLTAVSADPAGQAPGRHVQATTAGFTIDSAALAGVPITSNSLAGVVGEKVGMTGVQGFYAPNYPGALINGDFSVQYDPTRQVSGASGWFVANNISFTMAVYDLANLNLTSIDETNWLLSGDLLMSPENATMLLGTSYTDVGNFSMGVGSYCAPVPVPAAAWLFGSGLMGLLGAVRRKDYGQAGVRQDRAHA